jgi:plastocyanin
MNPHPRRLASISGALLLATATQASPVDVQLSGRSGALADAIVVFDPLDATPAPSHDTASIDQVNKQFVPRITVVRTGTAVSFPNSDNIRHQVYSFSQPKAFTLKLYAGTPAAPVLFDKPGLVILGCNIHDKMLAFVAVVDSPYFAKTDNAGRASIELPSGHYRLRVWHPNLSEKAPSETVTVANAPQSIPLNLATSSAPAELAAWPE